MKSVIALAACFWGMASLQGCGSSGDDTPITPTCDYGRAEGDHFVCPGHGDREVYVAFFNDLGDGDVKEVRWAGDIMNISGPGLAGTWSVEARLDAATCSGSVDFNVPGKPNPPDGPLTATVYSALAVENDCKSPLKYVITFSDDPASDADRTLFVNQWVEANLREDHVESTNITCPTHLAGNFTCVAGLFWDVKIDGTSLTLGPDPSSGEQWTVEGVIDTSDCSAAVDFTDKPNAPGPGQEQLAEIRLSVVAGQTVKDAMENPLYYLMFSDASGSSGRAGTINQWTQVSTHQQLASHAITA